MGPIINGICTDWSYDIVHFSNMVLFVLDQSDSYDEKIYQIFIEGFIKNSIN